MMLLWKYSYCQQRSLIQKTTTTNNTVLTTVRRSSSSLSSLSSMPLQRRRDNDAIITMTASSTAANFNHGGAVMSFSTKQQKQKKNKKKSNEEQQQELSYFERKAQRKETNRLKYQNKLSKQQQIVHRRDNSTKDVLKKQFNDWWQPHKSWQEMMNRKAKQQNKEWKIYVSAVLERLPVVLPDKTEWQQDYENLQAYLGQFGKEYPKELFPEHNDAAEDDSPIPLTDEELFALLPDNFKPSPRETNADETGDIHTMDRKLKDRVYFMIQNKKDKKDGESETQKTTSIEWTFPTVELKLDESSEGESLLEAAERAVNKEFTKGSSMNLYCPSNAPIACKMELFDENDDDNDKYMGIKTFFMRIQYDDENDYTNLKSSANKKQQQQAWLDRNEIVDNVQTIKGIGASKFYHYML